MPFRPTILRKKEENPLWHGIFAHSPEKVTMWAKRAKGKWDYKMAQIIASGQVPSRGQQALAQLRDPGNELHVFQMAQCMQHYDGHFKEILSPDRYAELQDQWTTGRLDHLLQPTVMAKRKDFSPKDFTFLLMEKQALSVSSFLAGSSTKQEELKKLLKQLSMEQKTWRTYMAQVKAHEDGLLGDFNNQVAQQQEALQQAWEEHKQAFFSVQATASCSNAMLLVNHARNQLADFSSSCDSAVLQSCGSADIPIIYEWNFPKAGSIASRLFGDVVKAIASSCSGVDSKMIMHIVVPPCQPMAGQGELTGDEREESIQECRDRLWRELSRSENKLYLRKVGGMWNVETFYSADRELNFEIWLVLGESTRVANKTNQFDHIFCNSVLLKRGAFPYLLGAMERKNFKNWRAPMSFDAGGKVPQRHEYMQWFSGCDWFGCLLKEVIKGSLLTQANAVLIAEGIPYDGELVQACVDINCIDSAKMPRTAYIGTSWCYEKELARLGVIFSLCACLSMESCEKYL